MEKGTEPGPSPTSSPRPSHRLRLGLADPPRPPESQAGLFLTVLLRSERRRHGCAVGAPNPICGSLYSASLFTTDGVDVPAATTDTGRV